MAAPDVKGDGSKQALDGSKCRVDLVPPQTIEAIGSVLGFGAKKYAAHNWMKGIPFSAISGGIMRHLLAFNRGEEIDPESGLPHLHHALCGLTFLSYYAHGPKNSAYRAAGMDDRVFRDA